MTQRRILRGTPLLACVSRRVPDLVQRDPVSGAVRRRWLRMLPDGRVLERALSGSTSH